MKTAIKASVAFLLVAAVVTSCKKYDEGPSLSLRSKKGRLAGEWEVEKYMENGVDKTSDFRSFQTSETIEFEKDGKYKYTATNVFLNVTSTNTSEGTWEFINDKEDVKTTVNVQNGSSVTPDSDTTHLIRLTNKECWTKDLVGNDTYEMHLKSK